MLFRKICGVDLGTDAIKILDKNEKLYVWEKNMIAIRKEDRVIAVGNKAYEAYEKAPADMRAESPMQHGSIANVRDMSIVLAVLLKRYMGILSGHPDVVITVPSGITELERMAFRQLASEGLRAKRVAFIESGLAHGAGIGMPVLHPMGNMVVDMGASSTDISVISEGKIIVGKRLVIGGIRLDEEIISIVRRRYDLNIGHRTAEILKNNLAYVLRGSSGQMKVYGIHAVTGIPSAAVIRSEDVNDAITGYLREISDSIKATLERTPPQLAADIRKNGIYLTGGVSQIPNLAEYVGGILEAPTYQVPDPAASAVRGLAQIMHDGALRKLTFPVKEL